MNIIKTQVDAIRFLQIGNNGDEILDQLEKLSHFIMTDVDDVVSDSMMNESENDDDWATVPDGLFEDDDDDDDIVAHTRPYQEINS